MTALWVTLAILLPLVLIAAWLLTLVGLPGNWIMVGVVVLYALLVPDDRRVDVGWPVVAVLVGLAVVGEIVEFGAGAAGTSRAGGSKRGAAMALLGSIVGGVAGLFVGLPIPVVGSFVGALLFAGAGAFLGALIGEYWEGRTMEDSVPIGVGAFWGRLLGTLAKTMVGAVMIVVTVVALVL
jgi:hypothetical protein